MVCSPKSSLIDWLHVVYDELEGRQRQKESISCIYLSGFYEVFNNYEIMLLNHILLNMHVYLYHLSFLYYC